MDGEIGGPARGGFGVCSAGPSAFASIQTLPLYCNLAQQPAPVVPTANFSCSFAIMSRGIDATDGFFFQHLVLLVYTPQNNATAEGIPVVVEGQRNPNGPGNGFLNSFVSYQGATSNPLRDSGLRYVGGLALNNNLAFCTLINQLVAWAASFPTDTVGYDPVSSNSNGFIHGALDAAALTPFFPASVLAELSGAGVVSGLAGPYTGWNFPVRRP